MYRLKQLTYRDLNIYKRKFKDEFKRMELKIHFMKSSESIIYIRKKKYKNS
jgi:hypothetical protein